MFNQIRLWIFAGGIAVIALGLTGCGKQEKPGQREAAAAEKEEKELSPGELSIEQVMSATCSHGKTLECDECRYEVGVVKVDPSLIKKEGGPGLIKTTQVAKRKMTTALNIAGEIKMNENAAVHVSPRIAGIIRSVKANLGDEVAKDDVLFTITSVELAQAMSDFEKNQALTELSGKTFQREKRLVEQKVGAENDMIEAQMRFEEYDTARKSSEQRLHVLGLQEKDIATLNPSNHNSPSGILDVRASMRGTLIEKHAAAGELVEPGKDVMVLADLNTVWMWGGVYERDLGLLLKRNPTNGLPVEIVVPAFPDTPFQGRMDYIGSLMDETTRTIPVRTVIDNKDRRLRPGMFCQGRILIGTDEETLAIPKEALLSDGGVDFVFIHMKDDYYLRVNVTKGREFADGVEILKGLTVGQTLVSEGAFTLKSDVLRSKMGAGCAD